MAALVLDGGSGRVWRLRGWNDSAVEERFLAEGLIAIGGAEMPDLSSWPGDPKIRQILTTALPQRTPRAMDTFVRYWRTFRIEMQTRDTVLVPLLGRRAAIGTITGDYQFHARDTDPRLRHRRSVNWLAEVDRSSLDDRVRKVVNAPGTLCQVRSTTLLSPPAARSDSQLRRPTSRRPS